MMAVPPRNTKRSLRIIFWGLTLSILWGAAWASQVFFAWYCRRVRLWFDDWDAHCADDAARRKGGGEDDVS